jgi:hypothetical protein
MATPRLASFLVRSRAHNPSPVDGPHSLFRIAWPGGRSSGQETVYLREFLWGETNIERADIFL